MRKICFLISILILFFAKSTFAIDMFSMGKKYFEEKNYQKASQYFIQAITENPDYALYRYYYAQTLTYLNDYKQAKKEYGYVIDLEPNSQLSNYSQQAIEYIDTLNNQTTTNTQPSNDNYIKFAIDNSGELTTWNKEKMPLKIYIDNSKGVSSAHIRETKNALNTWSSATENKFQYIYTNNPSEADITITFKGMAKKSENQTLGLTSTQTTNGYFSKATVTLYTLGQNYKPLTPNDLYNVALHEFGHLLGISGHSNNTNDVMYATYTQGKDKSKYQLSLRDKNTAKALYEIDRNPYSTEENSITNVLGTKQERIEEKLKQSLEYIKMVPNSPVGYVTAGQVYLEANDEYHAIEYFNKALKISPLDYSANQNLAKLYFERNDLKNAEMHYKNLIKIKPKEIAPSVDLANLYIRNNKTINARAIINSLIYRNSSAKNNDEVKKVLEKIKK